MISAIAAGNTVMYHTSEQVPHVCAVIQKIVQECFDESEVFSVMGGLEEAKTLLTLPFHHIFFTGSPRVGKIVMESAAKNLTSVTLELGGKSPTIVDKSANLRETAKRMLLVKFQVNGQVCITPDYVFVHKDVVRAFATELKKVTDLFLGEDLLNSENYSRIVNKRQYERMKELLKDVEDSGGEILQGGNTIDDENFVEPTFFIANRTDSRIMQEEIFGPILPLIPFERDEEIVEFINRNERPLASYIYSKNKKQIDYIVKNTRSGATVVNASGIHHYNENLPFGGINNSGIGKSHGFWGFQEFSNPRAMMKNNFLFHNINLLMPPHGRLKKWILEFTIKYL
jgi:aldehyde dehydrogenase (NAD+)